MKNMGFVFCIMILSSSVFAQGFDDRLSFSGVFDSTVNYALGAGNAPTNSFGIEEYANLRLRLEVGENAVLNTAFDVTALSGSFALQSRYAAQSGLVLVNEKNFSANIDLERLYLTIYGDYVDAEFGLFRIPLGYGQVFSSSDFLNPRNPLLPNARPRGVLGIDAAFYPTDNSKLMFFAAAPKNPLEIDGGIYIPGIIFDQHWDAASLQLLYAYETPLDETPQGIHRFGLSVKADLVLGFVLDGLYTLDANTEDGIEGLSLGAGFDYSFLDGDLYVLAEYLFNGENSSTSINGGGSRMNHHYLYGSALYRLNDFTSISLAALFCFDDLSFQPIASFSYEIFQGFTLNLSANLPLDQNVFNGGKRGELGPLPHGADAGAKLLVTASARLRF
jgi:hypothetical protein